MLVLVGAALCALAGAADLPAPRWRVQRRGLQQGAPQPERKQPNILLLFPDQWRYDWAGFEYPQTSTADTRVPVKLPTIARLAAEGTRFSQAYVPAPVCAPSRSCLASARDYDDQVATAGVPTNSHDYNITTPTFYHQLRKAGYHTMVTGKDDLTKASGIGYAFGTMCGKPPCGCPECIDGSSRYHQSELGFVDGLRSAGKNGVLANFGQPRGLPFDMYLLRQRFLLILPPFRSRDICPGAGTARCSTTIRSRWRTAHASTPGRCTSP